MGSRRGRKAFRHRTTAGVTLTIWIYIDRGNKMSSKPLDS